MKTNISIQSIENTFLSALSHGLIREEDTTVIFHDLTFLKERIEHLKSLFPPSALHAVAIKANPLIRILEFLKPFGTGIEAATAGEVYLALKAGYSPENIVYDSPVKTLQELEFALRAGVHINIDNLNELERIAKLKKEIHSESTFGIRINPQVGTGTILGSSVAGEYSKFGVPIKSGREKLRKAFNRFEWLTGIHLHVGSQGCSMDLLIKGIGVLYEFANEVNIKAGYRKIRLFDIGGGLPVAYNHSTEPVSMEEYVNAIKINFPNLFREGELLNATGHKPQATGLKPEACGLKPEACSLKFITEFGRWIHVNTGWVACKVEYVKHDPPANTAMIHAGADLFLRECLNPTDWKHEYSLLDKDGNLKSFSQQSAVSSRQSAVSSNIVTRSKATKQQQSGVSSEKHETRNEIRETRNLYNLAGPLCFSGDILARNVELPEVEEGDYLIIHDTGGYTFSMWSRYNSRQTPRILGYHNDGERFEILKERESFDDIFKFWK